MRRERGQALVEVCVLVPLLALLAGAVALAVLAAGAGVALEHAIDRGLIAAARGENPVPAVRRALPAGLRPGAHVERSGNRLRVSVDPPGPVGAIAASAFLPAGTP